MEGLKGSKDSKDYIEIIPSRKTSEYTTKEVDVNTLKVKYYEDYVPHPTPAKSVRSLNPMSEKKEPVKSSSHTFQRKEPVKSSSPMSEKREPVKSSSPMTEKREPVKSSSPMTEKREPVKSSSPMFEKREPVKSSTPKEPAKSSSISKESVRNSRPLPEKRDLGRSEKRESLRASLTSPFSEKKEPIRSPSSPFSEKKEPLRSPSSSLSEKKDVARSPSSPLSEKTEPEYVVADWPQTTRAPMCARVPAPTSPQPISSHRVLPKPPPLEVPTPPVMEEDRPIQVFEPRTPEAPKSPVCETSMPLSPAASEHSLPIPPSPQASDTSLPVPETPLGLDSAGDDPSVSMDHLVLPEAHSGNGGDTNGALIGETHSSSCLSASNGEHEHGEDTRSAKGSTSGKRRLRMTRWLMLLKMAPILYLMMCSCEELKFV